MEGLSPLHKKTLIWERVTRGHYILAGINRRAIVKRFPLSRNDLRMAVVGYNGMLRGEYVYHTASVKDGEPRREPILCQICGVSQMGTFHLKEIDPENWEDAHKIIETLPPTCKPALDFKPGKRVI